MKSVDFMMNYNQMVQKYPIGTIYHLEDKKYEVVGYNREIPQTAFLSLPSIVLKEIEDKGESV